MPARWPFFIKSSSILTAASLLTGIFFTYIWHLGTLTPGISKFEESAISASASFSNIIENPVFAPHKLVQLGFQALGESGAFWMRLSSVLFALAFLVFFYCLLKMWFGKFISALGTLLLASTPSLIIVARTATPDILFLAPIGIIGSFVWLTRTSRKNIAWFCFVFFSALAVYVPMMLVFLALSAIILHRPMARVFGLVKLPVRVASLGVAFILILPLILAAASDPSILRKLFFLPQNWSGFTETIQSTLWAGLTLVIRARENYPFIMDRLPLINAIQTILIVFGAYALWSRARKELYLVCLVVAMGILAAGINSNAVFLISALPVLGILAATGLRYLYKEWRDVFPINPLPRGLAVSLMVAVVIVNMLYGARYALIAWPHTESTRNTYNVLK